MPTEIELVLNPAPGYTFRDLLQLARTYQGFGFNRETISELLRIARWYWKQCWEEGMEMQELQ